MIIVIFNKFIEEVNNYLIENAIEYTFKIDDIYLSKYEKFDYETKFLFLVKKLVKIDFLSFINELLFYLGKRITDLSFSVVNGCYLNIILNNGTVFLLAERYNNFCSKLKNLDKGKKIDIEIISANPTGYLHIGHIRNAVVGKVLGNLYGFCGWDVRYSYYLNNCGVQIGNLAKSVLNKYLELNDKKIIFTGNDLYLSQEINDCAIYLNKKYSSKYLEINDENSYKKYAKSLEEFSWKFFFSSIKDDIADLNIVDIDYYSELQFLQKYKDLILSLKEKYISNPLLIYSFENAIWIKTSAYGDDKDRVLRKQNGEYTYFTSDIFYHYERYKNLDVDKYIDVWGADHHGYINRIKASLIIYDESRINRWSFLILQLVKLFKDNQEIKMSKRKGTNITYRNLKKMIGKNAIKYYLISKSLDKIISLDVQQIVQQNKVNPLYYFQYGFVRLYKLLSEIKQKNIFTNSKASGDLIIDSIDRSILFYTYEIKTYIERSLVKNDPSIFINYCYEFARLANQFYERRNLMACKNHVLKNWKIKVLEIIIIHYQLLHQLIDVDMVYKL